MILGSCTYLCQPIDVGINMADQWKDWILFGGGIGNGIKKTPTGEMVPKWIIGTYNRLREVTIHHVWTKKNYEWHYN